MPIHRRRRWIPDDMAPLAPAGAERVLEEWPEGLNVRERRETEPEIIGWLDADNQPLAIRTRHERGSLDALAPGLEHLAGEAPEGAVRFCRVSTAAVRHPWRADPDHTIWLNADGEEIT